MHRNRPHCLRWGQHSAQKAAAALPSTPPPRSGRGPPHHSPTLATLPTSGCWGAPLVGGHPCHHPAAIPIGSDCVHTQPRSAHPALGTGATDLRNPGPTDPRSWPQAPGPAHLRPHCLLWTAALPAARGSIVYAPQRPCCLPSATSPAGPHEQQKQGPDWFAWS